MMGAKTWWRRKGQQHIKERGAARTATLMLATRSASEFPTANIVRPMMASDRPKMKPNAWGEKRHNVVRKDTT